MKDLHSAIKVIELITPAVRTTDNTPVTIDRAGYESVEIVVMIGVGGITFDSTNKIEFKFTESDDDSTYTAVTADDLLGLDTVGTGGIIKALTAAHAAAGVYRVGYKGGAQYLKLLADFSGTHGTGTPMAAVAILSHGQNNPQADQI